MQSCVSSTKFFKAITIHIIILLSLIITTEEKNKYQYVSQNEGGGGNLEEIAERLKQVILQESIISAHQYGLHF